MLSRTVTSTLHSQPSLLLLACEPLLVPQLVLLCDLPPLLQASCSSFVCASTARYHHRAFLGACNSTRNTFPQKPGDLHILSLPASDLFQDLLLFDISSDILRHTHTINSHQLPHPSTLANTQASAFGLTTEQLLSHTSLTRTLLTIPAHQETTSPPTRTYLGHL